MMKTYSEELAWLRLQGLSVFEAHQVMAFKGHHVETVAGQYAKPSSLIRLALDHRPPRRVFGPCWIYEEGLDPNNYQHMSLLPEKLRKYVLPPYHHAYVTICLLNEY